MYMFVSVLAHLGAMQDKDVRQLNTAVLGCFSGLQGIVVGLAAATLYPTGLQFAGFWLTGIPLSMAFYFALQHWHKNLNWISSKKEPTGR